MNSLPFLAMGSHYYGHVLLLLPALILAAPLVVEDRTIHEFRATVSGLGPDDRAARAHQRIDGLPTEALTLPVHLAQEDGSTLVLIGDTLLFEVVTADGPYADARSLERESEAVASRLHEALNTRHELAKPGLLLRSVGLAVLATLFFALALFLLTRLWDFIERKLNEVRLDVKRVGLGPMIRRALRTTIWLAFWGVGLLLAYLWLAFVLTRFSFTHGWGEALGTNLWSLVVRAGRRIASSLPGLAMVALTIVLARFGVKLLEAFFDAVERGRVSVKGLYPETLKATRRLATVGIWLFAAVLSWPYIPGSETEAFKGMSVLLGLMLTVGSTGVVNQALSGFVLVYTRALSPGDWVKVGEIEGRVRELGVLSVKVLTPNKREVTIPNAVLVGNAIVNFDRGVNGVGTAISFSVTLSYDLRWQHAHELLLRAASLVTGVRKTPAPFVRQGSLQSFAVEYELVVHLDEGAPVDETRTRLFAVTQDVFREAKVEILTPGVLAVRRSPPTV